MTPQEAADRVDVMLRHCDLLPSEIDAVAALRDHARAELHHEVECPSCGATIRARMADSGVASCGVTSKGPAVLPADSYMEQER